MLSKIALALVSVLALSSNVLATPIARDDVDVEARSSRSLNSYGGFPSMSHFDNFYGSDNFDGSRFNQVFVQDERVVCRTVQVEIVQQRLAILREMIKRVITEQICEVEVQTIVFHQHLSGESSFSHDIHRSSGRSAGYDRGIAGRWNDLFNGDGSLSSSDLGFSGSSIGSNFVGVEGSNWNDNTSPASVFSAFQAAKSAGGN